MKPRLLFLVPVLVLALALPGAAAAQDESPGDAESGGASDVEIDATPDLFSWRGDNTLGVILGVSGAAGALVVLFFLVGGVVPGIAGRARIEAEQDRLDQISKRLDELVKAEKPNAKVITAIGGSVTSLRKSVRGERWALFAVAGFLYVLLGAFFALMLGHDPLQALAIGAGWTAIIGTLGLKTDFNERKAAKDEVIDALAGGAPPASIETDVRVAKAL
jgi:hypothetical protein